MQRLFPILIGLLSGLLFGLSTPISKLLLDGVDGFQLAGLLYLGAALAFTPRALRSAAAAGKAFAGRGSRLSLAGIVLFGGVIGPCLLMLGLKAARASSVSIWLNMELVMTALIGCLFFRDHLDGRAWLGVILTLAAGVLACLGEEEGNPASSLAAALLVTAACTAWALDNHLTSLMADIPAEAVTWVKGLFGGLTNMAIGTVVAGGLPPAAPSLLALGLGALSYGVSILLYVTSAQHLGATRSQILFSTGPFWGIFASFIILGERPGAATFAAMATLAGGITLASSGRHSHLHHHAALVHTHLHRHDDLHHNHSHEPEVAPGTWHSHEHRHEELEHDHAHYPDLHHRHAHQSD